MSGGDMSTTDESNSNRSSHVSLHFTSSHYGIDIASRPLKPDKGVH